MIPFERIPITITELMNWKRNKLINPRTNRTIKLNGKLFKFIESSYYNKFPKGFDFLDSTDSRDPVSLKSFYSIDISGNKLFEYPYPDNLIVYKESKDIIRCFEKDTLAYFKKYNIKLHPISQNEIPIDIFNDVEDIKEEESLSLEEKALQVFQLFTDMSIFIDYKKYLSLNNQKIIKLNYELKDFYYQNFSIEDRKKIDKDNGKKFLKFDEHDLRKDEVDAKYYLLEQIENLLKYKGEDLKFMINYIILGALSLVIDEVKEYYDNFNFSF